MNAIRLAALLVTASVSAQQPPLPADELAADLFPGAMPLGLPAELPAPADNPFTKASFALGRKLFFDPILSVDRTVACASCHDPAHGFASPEPFPLGVGGKRAARHSPTLFNRGFGDTQRWDGSTPTLEAFVVMPIEDPNEMNLPLAEAVGRLAESEPYAAAFRATYHAEPSAETLSRALSTFVRGLVLGDSPVDRFQAGNSAALTPAEKAGLWIYESKGGCWQCHSGPNLTDEEFHNTGVAVVDGVPEEGRRAATGTAADLGAFKTPTLRGVAQTAPYMHDGSLATLEDVVEFYRKGGHQNPNLDRRIAPLDLSEQDVHHLVAFLRALSRPAKPR